MQTVRRFARTLHRIFVYFVLAYAALLIAAPILWNIASAQDRLEVDRRLDNLEKLNLDHRLTVIETLLTEQREASRWGLWSMGGVGLLLGEAAIRVAKRKKGNTE